MHAGVCSPRIESTLAPLLGDRITAGLAQAATEIAKISNTMFCTLPRYRAQSDEGFWGGKGFRAESIPLAEKY